MTADTDQATVGGLAIATPGDWFAIHLPGTTADADRLAGELSDGRLGPAFAPELLRELVDNLVSACAALNVLCAYGTILGTQGGPLPATMTACVRTFAGQTLAEAAGGMSAGGDGAAAMVDDVDLPAGPAVRAERLQEWPGPDGARHPLALIVQYVIAVPGTELAALLTFSTPAVGLADQLRPLFHQIACTLRFEGTGALQTSSPTEPSSGQSQSPAV